MKLSLSVKWFLWLSLIVAIFCVIQIFGMIWWETMEIMRGEGSLAEELAEIAVMLGVSACVFILMLGGFWFVSKRMMKPIKAIAESANRISEGALDERIAGEDSPDEIGILVSVLNRAFNRYQEVVHRLDAFAGNAAHQMRTSLASVRSIGEVCLQKERSSAEYRQYIGEMLESVRELTRVVEKLLMIARLNPSRVRQQFELVDVTDVLSEVMAVYEVMLEEKNIKLNIEKTAGLKIKGDRNLVAQAIGNIVGNAVEFTPRDGGLEISLEKREHQAVLRVSDTGPGIPDFMCLHVSGNGDEKWNGEWPAGHMGLAIVSEVMKVHDGTVEIRRSKDGGTCVELAWSCSEDSC